MWTAKELPIVLSHGLLSDTGTLKRTKKVPAGKLASLAEPIMCLLNYKSKI